MNKLAHEERTKVVGCLIEGCSIRATVRMTGIAKKTVMRVLREVGEVCEAYRDRVFRNLTCRRIQLDELWGFNFCKPKNLTPEIAEWIPRAGDVWLWVALDADTKLVPCWRLGDRNAGTANPFIHDLASPLSNRVQLTSDGHRVYLTAVESAFGADVDYAMLVKMYGSDPTESETRYSPAECIGTQLAVITGKPDGNTSAQASWSVRIGQSAPLCGATLVCRMASRARLRIMQQRSP
jgi:hypothetical protein